MTSTWWQGVARATREVALPDEKDDWLPGYNTGLIFRARMVAGVLWIVSNLLLLGQMLHNPDLDARMAVLSVVLMNSFLGADMVVSLLFLRKWSRVYPAMLGCSLGLEMATLLLWVYMTGSVTSYFIGAVPLGLAFVRVLTSHRLTLIMTVIAVVAHASMYLLEARGLLLYAPLVRSTGVGGFHVPLGFRDMAATSLIMSYPFVFLSSNLFAKVTRRQREALERAQLELRRAADQARVGRLSGTRLGDYSIEDLLGRGGMGEVYAAKRVKDGKEVAVKLLHAHLGSEDKMRARFRREAEVVSNMPAGTVAAVYQFGTNEDGYDYIVMERLRGEDLGALLRRREKLELDEILAIVERVAVGLDAAHEQGVVHRDLKPQNIFLCGDEPLADVRLLDFGVARLHEAAMALSMTASAAVLGTPGYMPPEQAGGGEVGPSADVFALGAIVYRALTGKPAFPSRSPAGAMFEAFNYDPPPPSEAVPGLARDVDAVLALALAKNPELRYQRASELARDLAAAVRGELGGESRARAARLQPQSGVTMTS